MVPLSKLIKLLMVGKLTAPALLTLPIFLLNTEFDQRLFEYIDNIYSETRQVTDHEDLIVFVRLSVSVLYSCYLAVYLIIKIRNLIKSAKEEKDS